MNRRRPRPGPAAVPAGDRRRTATEFDALLDGGTSGNARLDQLLTAARGPALAAELAAPAPAVRTAADGAVWAPSRSRRVLTRLGTATLLTKAVTGGVGAVVVGAAAVAGATHHLPGQTPPRPNPVSSSASPDATGSGPRSDAPSSSARRSSSSASSSTASPTTTPSISASTSTSASPSASGAADLPALCRAWLALPAGADAARRAPRFGVLVKAAGGAPAVTAFCRALPTLPSEVVPSSSGSSTRGSALPSRTKSKAGRDPGLPTSDGVLRGP